MSLEQAVAVACDFEERSKRSSIPVRTAFVRSGLLLDAMQGDPPMATLLRGGRGGFVRIATMLALIWRCSAEPYNTDIKASAIARLWNLPSPDTNGARRVQEALVALADRRLISVERHPGKQSTITLLDDAGTGGSYESPNKAYNTARRRKVKPAGLLRHNYFKVDANWWKSGQIQQLKGPGLAILLILLSEDTPLRRETGIWISPSNFQQRYGLSVDTRKVGLKQLQDLKLISASAQLQQDVFVQNRRRVFYELVDPNALHAYRPMVQAGMTESDGQNVF